ncbi:MAG: hypothetical protein QS98_C0012G0009 [archaeon GW2011_AR3]|nr:MAG: hypothetical protein QS98_C0012G0009 [archaeon GW2011_AR3]MBS3108992.1 hypothetical protein [Candidatus Woesearchaeota archaeon]
MQEGEKLNLLVKEIMRTKIANDFQTATKIAEALIAYDSQLSEGERYFKQVIFNKVTEDLIKWFSGNNLEGEFQRLENEISGLKKELADIRKIAVQGAERAPAASPRPAGQETTAHQAATVAPPKEEPKKASVGAGASRQEMNPTDYDISKVFYFGNKRQ